MELEVAKQKFSELVISLTQENQVLFQQYIEDFWKNLNKDVNSTQKIEENRNQDSKLNEEQIFDNKEALIEQYKSKGNEYFQKKNYHEAAQEYSKALGLNPNNYLVLSNRSATKYFLGDYEGALKDANECLRISPQWEKVKILLL
mgnify:CR=1 FL=1